WVRQVREPVRFADALAVLQADGVTRALELGPDSVLSALARSAADEATAVPALRTGHGDIETLFSALAHLHVLGVPVDWAEVYRGLGARRVTLPTYAFRRKRYWLDPLPKDQHGTDPLEADFWRDVEAGDVDRIADTLHVTDAGARDSLSAVVPALGDWRRTRAEESVVDSWRYRIDWRPMTVEPSTLHGTWLVVGDDPEDEVSSLLRSHGAHVIQVRAGAEPPAESCTGALVLPGVTPAHLLTLVRGSAGIDRLWVCTRGAVSVNRADRLTDPSGALLWGLGRVAALELPQRWGGLIDLPVSLDQRARSRVAAVLSGGTGEDQVAVRAAGVFGRRLR
ncbi:polyketide synthase, partial [Streptomyces sp. ACA25]|nr:polyketide synthase [Streptomyces sp. ACA25]